MSLKMFKSKIKIVLSIMLLFFLSAVFAVGNSSVAAIKNEDIPKGWPLRDGIGHISLGFGPYTDAITNEFSIHKGLDISTGRAGDSVVATADGQVIKIDNNEKYGNYIIIEHKNQIATLYARLSFIIVKEGDFVQKGDTIGLIGDAGEPFLHYEIHIGMDCIDPSKFIGSES